MIYWIYDGDELLGVFTSWDKVEKYLNDNNYMLYDKLIYNRGNDKFDTCIIDVIKRRR